MKKILQKKPKLCFLYVAVAVWSFILMAVMIVMPAFAATTDTYECFQISVESSQQVEIESNPAGNGWTIKAYGQTTSGCSGTTTSTVDVTITITNTGTKADGSVRNVNFKITTEGTTSDETSAEKTLDATTTQLQYTATSGKGSDVCTTITISIPEFRQESLGATFVTTVKPGDHGNAYVDGEKIENEKSFSATDDRVFVLTVQPDDGYELLGWMSDDGLIPINDDNSCEYANRKNATIWPMFVPEGSAIYYIQGATPITYYSDLSEAITAAGSSGVIVLYRSGALQPKEGGYTIPSGVTLLIPFDAANTLVTDNAEDNLVHAYDAAAIAKTEYRRLTLLPGVNITVASGGVISIGSKIANQFIGQVGPYGAISMKEGSNITVQSGGFLYAWGYIFHGDEIDGKVTGGTVTVESGGTVYEPMECLDYPGSASLTTELKEANVFPMRAYVARNVEVPMTLNSGANEYVFACLYGDKIGGNYPQTMLLISTQQVDKYIPLFQPASGTQITKSFVNGRQRINIAGDLNMNSMTVSISLKSGLTQKPIQMSSSDTSGFVIPSSFDVSLISGTLTLNDNVIMAEGSTLEVAKGAVLNTNGKAVYVLAAADDPGAVSGTNGCSIDVKDVYGNYYSNVPKDAVLDINGKIIVSGGFYTSEGKASIISSEGSGEIEIIEALSTVKEVRVKKPNSGYQDVTITSAYLKNADGKEPAYTETTHNGTFKYENGEWICDHVDEIKADETDGSDGYCDNCNALICQHNYVDTVRADNKATDATCTAQATYYKICSECGAKSTETFASGELAAHTPADAVRENEVGATCYAAGSYDEVVYCSVETCKAEISRTSKASEKIAHTPGKAIRENEVPATCYAEGSYDEVIYCSVEKCKHEISRTEKTIEKKQHTPAEAVRENEVGATCYAEGSYDEVVYCSVEACKHEISRTTKTIEKTSHTPAEAVREKEVAATCYSEGSYEEVIYCSVEKCKHEISREQKTTEKKDHTPATAVRENVTAPTCGADGSYDSVVYCSVAECKYKISSETMVDPATGEHTYDNNCDTECNVCKADRTITHDYVAVLTAPTCKEGGYTTYTCSVCGDSYVGNQTEPAGHTPGEPVVENADAATCGHAGSYDEVVYCSVKGCGEKLSSEHKTVEKLPHSPAEAVQENVVPATCHSEGSYNAVVYCSVCTAKLSTTLETIEKIAHTPGEAIQEDVHDSTCYAVGSYNEVVYCSVKECGEKLSTTPKTIEKKEHTHGEAVREDVNDSTCYAEGSYNEVVYCSVVECGEKLSTTPKTIEKKAHTPAAVVQEKYKAPTCYAEGSYEEVVYCSVEACKHEISRTPKTVQKTEHTAGKAVSENEVPATCYAEGSYNEVVYCSVAECGEKLSSTPKTIDKIAHTHSEAVREDEVPATCYAEGSYNEVVYCSVAECGEKLSSTPKTIDKIAHTPGEAVRENEVPATCYAEGYYDEVVYCSIEECKHEISREEQTIEKLSHTPGDAVNENVVGETCYRDGSFQEVIYCTVCKAEISRVEKGIPKSAHTDGRVAHENVVDATCSLEGSYDEVHYCTVPECNQELSREVKAIDKIPHTKGEEIREDVVDATCGAAGSYTSIYKCTVCGQEISRTPNTVIPATNDHNYTIEGERVEPTCTEAGYYIMGCECGNTQMTPIPTEGHKYEAVVTNPTCTTGGITVNTCSKCGDSYQSDPVPATGHKDTDGDNLCDNPNCDAIVCQHVWSETIQYVWSEDYLHCSAIRTCTLNDQHTETAIATVQTVPQSETTCTTDGVTYYIAIFVEEWIPEPENEESEGVVKVTIPATNHKDTLVQVEAKVPTCTESGHEAYEYCTACDHTTYVEIPSLGHKYEAVKTDPTCSAQGYTTHTCSVCTDSYVDTYVDATGEHDYSVTDSSKKETWSECSVCKEKVNVQPRTYDVTIVDYWGNKTVRQGYTYGQYLWLNYSTSNVLDLEYVGWEIIDENGNPKTVQAYEVWESFAINNDTTELTVREVSTVKGVKYGAIMMSVSYDQANSEKTMTVDLFIYVDSLDDAHKPSVKLGEDTLSLEKVDDSLMMWFVSIPLSAEQITQGGSNVQITVSYQGVPVKTIDSVLIAYEKALEKYLEENVGDYAGSLQDEAISAMLNYGKTVQVYFENEDPSDWNFEGYTDIADYASNIAPTQKSNEDGTFTWMGANVRFDEEYSMRYDFDLPKLEKKTIEQATLIVTDASGKETPYPVEVTPKADGSGLYSVVYPVPASDLAKAGTTVRLIITLTEGGSITSSEYEYGIYAHLTYSVGRFMEYEDEDGTMYHKNLVSGDDGTGAKTKQYVNMLVSLIKLGEAVNEIEAMTAN